MSKRCRECGRFVGAEQTVCDSCAAKYAGEYNAIVLHPRTVRRKAHNQHLEDGYSIDIVAAELKKDISSLMELGIKLDKGSLAAKTGGAGLAGYEALSGDWLSALVIGGISLLVGGLTTGYKHIKLMEMKKKWWDIFSGLSQEQLVSLGAGLRHKYPMLMGQLQNLLQAPEG